MRSITGTVSFTDSTVYSESIGKGVKQDDFFGLVHRPHVNANINAQILIYSCKVNGNAILSQVKQVWGTLLTYDLFAFCIYYGSVHLFT